MVDDIIKEIEDNPVQNIQVESDATTPDLKPTIISVDLRTRRQIITDWLSGLDKRSIAQKYELPTRSITAIVDNNEDIRLDIEKRFHSTVAARENIRLADTKDKMLSYINQILDDTLDPSKADGTMTDEKKVKFLNNIAMLWDRLSSTLRLNQEKPTSISETRSLKVDLDKILAQLPTPEDKLAFLRNQSQGAKIVEAVPINDNNNQT
jgi:hypothetical protein